MGCEDFLIDFFCPFIVLFQYNSKEINCDQVANEINVLAEEIEARLAEDKAGLEPPKELAQAPLCLFAFAFETP